MIPKRLLAIILGITIVAMGRSDARSQWVQTNGPYGGYANCFLNFGKTIFAGSAGIFQSIDSGKSWSPTTAEIHNITALATDGVNLFAGTDSPSDTVSSIWQSTDRGRSWLRMPWPWHFIRVTRLALNANYLFVGTNFGLIRSYYQNYGWEAKDFGFSTPVFDLTVQGSKVFASTIKGVYCSTDNGDTWDSIPGLGDYVHFFANGQCLFAGSDSGFFRSMDTGITWIKLNTGLPGSAFAFTAIGANIFANISMDHGIFCSSDTGRTWKAIDKGLPSNYYYGALTSVGSNLLAGTDAGIYASSDSGVTWEWSSKGFTDTYVESLGIYGTKVLAGISFNAILDPTDSSVNTIFRSSDNGEKWVNGKGTNRSVWMVTISDKNIFAGTERGVYLSRDSGLSWIASGLSNTDIYTITAFGSYVFAGSSDSIFHSSDNGRTWFSSGAGLDPYFDFRALTGDGQNLLVGADAMSLPSGIFLSTDTGNSWTFENSGLNSTVVTMLVNDANIFAGTYDGVYYSTNNGKNWTQRGLNDRLINSLVVRNANLFAGTDIGVFLSTDFGYSWVNTGLQKIYVYTLALNDSELFAGTFGRGVWRRPLSDFGISAVTKAAQPIAETVRAYPNPFTQSTTITLTPESAGYAEVTIVNPLGTEVAHLFSGQLRPGEHRFTWSDPSLSNGIYECVVRMNGRLEKVGIVLLR